VLSSGQSSRSSTFKCTCSPKVLPREPYRAGLQPIVTQYNLKFSAAAWLFSAVILNSAVQAQDNPRKSRAAVAGHLTAAIRGEACTGIFSFQPMGRNWQSMQ